MSNRIFQLALGALEIQKTQIENEIAEVRAELKGIRPSAPQTKQSRSERMKAYWAAKRAGSSKIASLETFETGTKTPAKDPPPGKKR